jgi:hypothetical protein
MPCLIVLILSPLYIISIVIAGIINLLIPRTLERRKRILISLAIFILLPIVFIILCAIYALVRN